MIKKFRAIIEREKINSPGVPAYLIIPKRGLQYFFNKVDKLWGRVLKNSTFRSSDDLWMCSLFPKKILDVVLHKLHPATLLDVGCGTGASLTYFINNGVDAWGIENSTLAISRAANPEKIIHHNLNKEINLGKKFDMVWCFEVIEHIHPDFEHHFLKTLTNHSENILLSAAQPGQGGHGHFNEQLPGYWINKFKALGYQYQETFSAHLRQLEEMHVENMMFFKKVPGV